MLFLSCVEDPNVLKFLLYILSSSDIAVSRITTEVTEIKNEKYGEDNSFNYSVCSFLLTPVFSLSKENYPMP